MIRHKNSSLCARKRSSNAGCFPEPDARCGSNAAPGSAAADPPDHGAAAGSGAADPAGRQHCCSPPPPAAASATNCNGTPTGGNCTANSGSASYTGVPAGHHTFWRGAEHTCKWIMQSIPVCSHLVHNVPVRWRLVQCVFVS